MLEIRRQPTKTEDSITDLGTGLGSVTNLSRGKSQNTSLLQEVPEKLGVQLQTDPGKFYLFLLIRVGGFQSITELKDFVGLSNESLMEQLDNTLNELESSGQILINGDDIIILASKDGFELNTQMNCGEIFADFSQIITRRAFTDFSSEDNKGPKNKQMAGYNYFIFRDNKEVLSRVNAVCERFKADLQAIASEHVSSESPNFSVVALSKASPKPEDF